MARLHGGGPPMRVCGNLPYNISTPLLFHLLESRAVIADMHFMLQKEVVERMAAKPGGKEYGRLTVMLAAVCRVEVRVPGRARRLQSAAGSRLGGRPADAARWMRHSRCRIARALPASSAPRSRCGARRCATRLRGLAGPAEFEAAGIEPGRRPETLSPAEFAKLAAQPAIVADSL